MSGQPTPFVLALGHDTLVRLMTDTKVCPERIGLRSVDWMLEHEWAYIHDGYGQEFFRATRKRRFFQKLLKIYPYPCAFKKVNGFYHLVYQFSKNKDCVRLWEKEQDLINSFNWHSGYTYHEHTALTLGYSFYRNLRIASYVEYGLEFYMHRGHKFYVEEGRGTASQTYYIVISGPLVNDRYKINCWDWGSTYWRVIRKIDEGHSADSQT